MHFFHGTMMILVETFLKNLFIMLTKVLNWLDMVVDLLILSLELFLSSLLLLVHKTLSDFLDFLEIEFDLLHDRALGISFEINRPLLLLNWWLNFNKIILDWGWWLSSLFKDRERFLFWFNLDDMLGIGIFDLCLGLYLLLGQSVIMKVVEITEHHIWDSPLLSLAS